MWAPLLRKEWRWDSNIPLLDVNHLHGHLLSHFIRETENQEVPEFPFIALLVSGGNSQIVLVKSRNEMEILGQTIDDAAGEAFDKCAKSYGTPLSWRVRISTGSRSLAIPGVSVSANRIFPALIILSAASRHHSFTPLRDETRKDQEFVKRNMNDLCASLQHTIIEILLDKLKPAIRHTGASGMWPSEEERSANSGVPHAVGELCASLGVRAWIPKRAFTTDNAAMVAIAGYFKYLDREFSDISLPLCEGYRVKSGSQTGIYALVQDL